jgi:hypothetical protein
MDSKKLNVKKDEKAIEKESFALNVVTIQTPPKKHLNKR